MKLKSDMDGVCYINNAALNNGSGANFTINISRTFPLKKFVFQASAFQMQLVLSISTQIRNRLSIGYRDHTHRYRYANA